MQDSIVECIKSVIMGYTKKESMKNKKEGKLCLKEKEKHLLLLS